MFTNQSQQLGGFAVPQGTDHGILGTPFFPQRGNPSPQAWQSAARVLGTPFVLKTKPENMSKKGIEDFYMPWAGDHLKVKDVGPARKTIKKGQERFRQGYLAHPKMATVVMKDALSLGSYLTLDECHWCSMCGEKLELIILNVKKEEI
ncbi:hypothetical protein WMY93_011355 [Mugilogobius chulae]|uniref:Uncharacterized protein n=1 Tax=Mugilogobius chulae TaxID=88201 RepID=A0AAW0PBA5_9GOBI